MHNIFNNIVSKTFPICFDASRHHLQGVLLLYQSHIPEFPEDDALRHRNMYEIFRYNSIKYTVHLLVICCKYMQNAQYTRFQYEVSFFFGCFQ
jgi:hypothetical protein